MSKQIIISVFTAWFIAQILLKIIVASFKKKKLFIKAGVMGGGMPSGHSALVAALCTAIGLTQGFLSPLFIITCVFSALIVFQVLIEKRVIVRFFEEIAKEHPKKHILEELGHSALEVGIGLAIGIFVVLAFFNF